MMMVSCSCHDFRDGGDLARAALEAIGLARSIDAEEICCRMALMGNSCRPS